MPMNIPANSISDNSMTDSTTPSTTNSLPNPAIASSTSESIQVNGTTSTPTSLSTITTTTHIVSEVDKTVLSNTTNITPDLALSDINQTPILTPAELLPRDPNSLIEPSHRTITPSIPSVDLLPLTATVPAGFGVPILHGLDISVNAANEEFIVLNNGLIAGTTDTVESGLLNAQTPVTESAMSAAQVMDTQPSSTPSNTVRSRPTAPSVPWQDILIDMISELGFVESSRMMAAEELVLSRIQHENAPKIIEKFTKLLQESASGQANAADDNELGSSKRRNINSGDLAPDMADVYDSVKRRRVDDAHGMILENTSRDEIEKQMIQFMAEKREQINESNRHEFIKGRVHSTGHSENTPNAQEADAEDDGCARVDARKLNRTIQMKLETVKNEALTKTNPKSHTQQNDTSLTNSGLDERLRNIQVHLNLRFAAVPACTIAERIRVIEDVIIQLERDYPLWSALHFNQPNRVFPPPPSVTTVSRNARNQIVMSGDHLHTTLIDSGDAMSNPAVHAQYPGVGLPSAAGSSSAQTQRLGSQDTGPRTGGINSVVNDNRGAVSGVQARPGAANPGGTGGSATVIKLKRHGGAGSSSLARAVQQQLAQRKANAAASGATDDIKQPYGAASSFKITPAPHRDSPSDNGSSAIKTGANNANLGNSLSSNIAFADPLKPGVTGRGPIKSRRKSIAKGLDPTSAMASMNVAHAGNILGTNPMTGRVAGAPMSLSSQPSVMSEASLGSIAATKAKAASAKKPRKKKGEENIEESGLGKLASRPGAGRGKGGFGLGKGKGGGRPTMGLGLGKGKGGAYRQELLRQAEVEEFDEDSDEDVDDDGNFQSNTAGTGLGNLAKAPASTGNGSITTGNTTTFQNDNSALAHLVSSALKDVAVSAQQKKQQEQQQQQQQQEVQSPPTMPRKPSTPAKPPPVRKFGGKSFGMMGGESSGSSNESSDGEGSSGSQSDSSSSSGSISGSDPGDSD